MRNSDQGGQLTILLASDQSGRRQLSATLADHDNLTLVGTEVANAAEMANQKNVYDAVMVDLPSADLALLKEIREVAPNLPILIIADAQFKFDNERMCTELAPAALIVKTSGRVRADDLVCTLRAIVPERVSA